MRTLRLYKRNDLRLCEEEAPTPRGGEVLLRVAAVGICGSDLHWLEEGSIGDVHLTKPLILGHEFAATIASGHQKGLRVAVDPSIPCGSCRYCAEGNTNLCVALRFAGQGTEDGALRAYMAWPAGRLHPLPDSMSDEEGALLEPLGIALHAADLGHLSRGRRVGIFGCGPIGLLIQRVCLAEGAVVVVAADPIATRREAARRSGAAFVLDPDAVNYPQDLAEACAEGLDITFEASNDHHAIQAAVDAARPGGRVVITGIPSDDTILLRASSVRRKGLTLLLTRRMREVYDRSLHLVESGQIDLLDLVTHRYDLAEFDTAFNIALERKGLKIILKP